MLFRSWLTDESALRPKLLRHFEAGVVPRVELVGRQLSSGEDVDLHVIVDRSETPYVTRLDAGRLEMWLVSMRGPLVDTSLKCLYLVVRSLDPTGRGRKRWMNRWKAALTTSATPSEARTPPTETRNSHRQSPDQPAGPNPLLATHGRTG